jgi:hypothetical protein
MRTSAEKKWSLCARIEKEISRASDRTCRARNFTPIAGSRKTALEANALDRNFSRHRALFARDRRAQTNFSSRSKKNFRSRKIVEQSQ